MLETLTIESFEPHLGTTFAVDLPDGAKLDLRLVRAAKVMESEAAQLRRHPFSLYFAGPDSVFLPQHMYRLVHGTMPALEIFLVPVAKEKDGYLYEAVFT